MTLHGNDAVGRAMHAPVVTIGRNATLRAAAAALSHHDIGVLAVVESSALIGVLSERDLVRSLGAGDDPDTTRVEAALTDLPRAVDADSPLWVATRLMLQMGVRHLPVTESHRTVGMLSIRDALAVIEGDRISAPGSTIETVHDSLGPTRHRSPSARDGEPGPRSLGEVADGRGRSEAPDGR